jgi:hypothetical protein
LAVALTRALPAPHQHRHFLVATDERRQVALSRATSTAARPHQAEQSCGLGHTLQRVGAALLSNEEPGDLALHPRRDQNRAGFGERLHPRRNIGYVAVDLARRIEHRWARFDADAGAQLRLASGAILAVELDERELNRERCPRRAFGAVLCATG